MKIDIDLDIIRDIKNGVKDYPVKAVEEDFKKYCLVKDEVWNSIYELLYQIDKELGYEVPEKE